MKCLPFSPTTDSKVQTEIDGSNTRYTTLGQNIHERMDELELMEQFIVNTDDAEDLLTWCANTDSKLDRQKPSSNDPEKLEQEIETFRVSMGYFVCIYFSIL